MYIRAIKTVLSLNILFIVSSFSILCFCIFMFTNTMNLPYFIRECFGLLLSSLFCSLFYGLSSSIVACMIHIIKSDTNKKGFNVIYTRGASYSYPSLCTFSIPFIISLFVGIRWLHHWERCLSWCIAIC